MFKLYIGKVRKHVCNYSFLANAILIAETFPRGTEYEIISQSYVIWASVL